MISTKKSAIRSKFIALEAINFGLKPLFTSLVSLFIIRWFNVELWGSFVVYLVAVQLFVTFLSWGQKPYLTKMFAAEPAKIGLTWGRVFIARVPLLIVSICFIALIPEFQAYFIPLILWVVFKWLTVMLESLIQFNRDYTTSIKSELLSITVTSLLLYFWIQKVDLEVLIYVFAISNGIKCFALIPIIIKNKITVPSLRGFRFNLLASFPFFALNLAGMFQTRGDLYLATFLMEEADLGRYQVLIGFLLLGQAFSGIVLGPFLKNVFRLKENDIQSVKKLYVRVGLCSSMLFTIALFFLMSYVYLIDLDLKTVVLIFFYLVPLYFFMIESQLMVKHKKEKTLLKLTAIAALSNLGLSIVLIPLLGIQGALLGGIVGKIILGAFIVRQSKQFNTTI